MKLGKRQLDILKAMAAHGGKWYPGGGWLYDTTSGTRRTLQTMVAKGLVASVEFELHGGRKEYGFEMLREGYVQAMLPPPEHLDASPAPSKTAEDFPREEKRLRAADIQSIDWTLSESGGHEFGAITITGKSIRLFELGHSFVARGVHLNCLLPGYNTRPIPVESIEAGKERAARILLTYARALTDHMTATPLEGA